MFGEMHPLSTHVMQHESGDVDATSRFENVSRDVIADRGSSQESSVSSLHAQVLKFKQL